MEHKKVGERIEAGVKDGADVVGVRFETYDLEPGQSHDGGP